MKTTKQMAAIITKLAALAGADLSKTGEHFKIENPPYMRLCVDVIGRHLVSVTHYYEQNGDLIPDPDMVFFTGYGVEAGWVPVSIQHNTGRYTLATEVKGGEVVRFYQQRQAQLASFANLWARNIKAQHFLKAAQHDESSGDSEMAA